MHQPLPLSAATGGLAAALVTNLFNPTPWHLDPALLHSIACQESLEDRWLHYPSLLLGIGLGVVGSQLLDLLVLTRQYLRLVIRRKCWNWDNATAVRHRLA